jgi:guanylate kinase
MKSGKLIVITGPSGVGKGTLVKLLLSRHPELYLSISTTTRNPRLEEEEGQHYYFVDHQKFQEMIESNSFLEWAQYTNNFYGTPRDPVEERLKDGQSVLLEIEVIGAKKIKASFTESLTIFILPPSLEELKDRLVGRGTENTDSIKHRLEKAEQEIIESKEFDHRIYNDDLEIALENLEQIIFPA